MTALHPVRASVDAAAFTPEVEAALTALASDVSYAVSIARAASTIRHKRHVWAQRRDTAAADPA